MSEDILKISIVVPCYDEEDTLKYTIGILKDFFNNNIKEKKISTESEIVFVDDGSKDKTWSIICDAAKKNNFIKGIKLSRNRGHQNALLAGMSNAVGDFIITIDADLQDDINAIIDMINFAKSGSEIVYGVRKNREADTGFKRFTAESYYKVMRLLGVELIFNHADFRGMSKRAVRSLLDYKEVNLFLRGIVPQLGYSTSIVYYDRKERLAGETKYPLKKMLSFAWQGITSFSTIPLKALSWCGVTLALVSVIIVAWALLTWLISGNTVPGWTSTVVPIIFFSGVQLFGLGIIGEYLGKIYLEVKKRPRFFIEQTENFNKENE